MKKALALVALLLVAAFPVAEAAGPEPRPWSAYNALSDVRAIALAKEGTTIGVALAAAVQQPTPPTGVPGLPGAGATTIAQTDLSILDHDYGFARNGTINAATPLGRTHVAVSRDGTSVATIGRDMRASVSGTTEHLELYFGRVARGGNWSGTTPYERTFDLGDPASVTPVGIALSDDGHRLAVLTAEGSNYVLRGYNFGGSSLDGAFDIRAAGTPRALAATGDLSRLSVAGRFVEGNFTYGGVRVFPFAQADALAAFSDRTANNTDVLSVGVSRDGQTAIAGGPDGRLHVFRSARESLEDAQAIRPASGAIGNLTMSEDGRRAAIAIGTTVTMIDVASASVIWNASVTGVNITSLAMNATGGILVVGTGGTGGAAIAYSDVDNTPLWNVPGDTRAVAINSDGTRVVYGQRVTVGASTLPRALVLELATGGKTAPTQVMAAPGSTTFAVSLRNDGAATERVVFEDSSADVDVTTEPSVVNVRPGAIVRVNLTVTAGSSLVAPRVFNVTARSITSGAVDNVTLSVAPQPTLDVKLVVNTTDVVVEPGRSAEILVTIVNNGTGDAAVGLRATQAVSSGPLWDITVTESSLTALRGTRASVKVVATPPPDAPNGTSSTVDFTLEGQDIFDTARVVFRINPELKVDVNATGVTKLVQPGERASYNVTVTNIGSLPREFDVFYTVSASEGRSWGVDMASAIVRLEPLQKRTFAVAIIAPADAQPDDRVSVRVSARSIPIGPNETIVEDNVTLFGIAIERKITTTTTPTGIPGFAPLAAVAALLFAGVLLRRRQQ